MSKKYLEIKQELTENEKIERLPELIRVEVTDEAEAQAKMKDLKGKVRNGKAFLHTHHHYADSKLNKPCEVKELKEAE